MSRIHVHKLAALLLALIWPFSLLSASAADAAASPLAEQAAARAGCVGTGFAGTLANQKAICNGNYLVRMQGNGDLVLRVISTGRACWSSRTAGAWSNDASAVFHKNIWGVPYVDIHKTSQGRLTRILGAHGLTELGSNASVNRRGEFWIGFKKIGSC